MLVNKFSSICKHFLKAHTKQKSIKTEFVSVHQYLCCSDKLQCYVTYTQCGARTICAAICARTERSSLPHLTA